MAILSPSLLAADFSHLGPSVKKIYEAGASYLHLDVMDGIFVPNISFGPCVIKAIRPCTNAVFDVHLMIDRPERYIDEFIESGADVLTIHYEATASPADVLTLIRQKGIKACIAIKPNTPIDVLDTILPLADMVLIMTVEPGFGGQKLLPETVDKIAALDARRKAFGYSFLIEADGGITMQNIHTLSAAGVDVFVAGSAVFGAQHPEAAVQNMLKAALNAKGRLNAKGCLNKSDLAE
ncbi:MAG: ribulose-phosphate 3-epimerase [Clostridiales bacterium]|nr:ribulose-phosphate 3-epimerase [Clostridiales bacterium]